MSKIQINAVVMLGLVSLWFAGVHSVSPYGSPVRIEERFKSIPLRIGEWQATRSVVKLKPDGLSSASTLDRVYVNSQGYIAYLTIVYAVLMSDLHQPEVCLSGQGWLTSDQHVVALRPKRAQPFKATANRMDQENAGTQNVTIYWFSSRLGNTRLLSVHKARIYLISVRDRTQRRSALIRIMAPVQGDPDRAEAAAKSFAEQA